MSTMFHRKGDQIDIYLSFGDKKSTDFRTPSALREQFYCRDIFYLLITLMKLTALLFP